MHTILKIMLSINNYRKLQCLNNYGGKDNLNLYAPMGIPLEPTGHSDQRRSQDNCIYLLLPQLLKHQMHRQSQLFSRPLICRTCSPTFKALGICCRLPSPVSPFTVVLIDLSLLTSIHTLYRSPQTQQALPRNLKAALKRKPGRITTDFQIPLKSSKTNTSVFSPALQQSTCCYVSILSFSMTPFPGD